MQHLVTFILLISALHWQVSFSEHYDLGVTFDVPPPEQATYETKNNPKLYNIGAILSSNEHIHAFIKVSLLFPLPVINLLFFQFNRKSNGLITTRCQIVSKYNFVVLLI